MNNEVSFSKLRQCCNRQTEQECRLRRSIYMLSVSGDLTHPLGTLLGNTTPMSAWRCESGITILWWHFHMPSPPRGHGPQPRGGGADVSVIDVSSCAMSCRTYWGGRGGIGSGRHETRTCWAGRQWRPFQSGARGCATPNGSHCIVGQPPWPVGPVHMVMHKVMLTNWVVTGCLQVADFLNPYWPPTMRSPLLLTIAPCVYSRSLDVTNTCYFFDKDVHRRFLKLTVSLVTMVWLVY